MRADLKIVKKDDAAGTAGGPPAPVATSTQDPRAEVAFMHYLMERYPKQALRKARQMRDNQIRGPG